jgi:hypothetical protein
MLEGRVDFVSKDLEYIRPTMYEMKNIQVREVNRLDIRKE